LSKTAARQGSADELPGADTLSERAAALIERDIIGGQLMPGTRLAIADLALRYGLSATPLREGLSRLVSRGLIVAIGQRGFHVASVSREDLFDITRMRVIVEVEALRLAMENGDDAWEANIVAALHRMRRYIERVGVQFREGADNFDSLHKSFHTSLLDGCGSYRLLSAHSDLYDQAYRYRRVMMGGFDSGEKFVEVHQKLAERAIARDLKSTQAMLAEHLELTLHYVYPTEQGRKF
jgi:GntR family transcriptional regulator, carbon starvation induced regulator